MMVMKAFVTSSPIGSRTQLPNHDLWYVSVRIRVDDSQIAPAALEVTPIVLRLDFVRVDGGRKHGRGHGFEGLEFGGPARGLATLVQHGRIGDLLGAMGQCNLALAVSLPAASGQVQHTALGTTGTGRLGRVGCVIGDAIALGDLCFWL